jgi:hypothetical protein
MNLSTGIGQICFGFFFFALQNTLGLLCGALVRLKARQGKERRAHSGRKAWQDEQYHDPTHQPRHGPSIARHPP